MSYSSFQLFYFSVFKQKIVCSFIFLCLYQYDLFVLSFGHLCFTSSPQTSNFKYALHQSSGRLCFIISFPISIFKYVLHQFLGHFFLVIFSFSSTFFVFFFHFLLLSAGVSIVICLCFFDILLLVRRPSYNVYYGRRTVRTTVVIQCVLRLSYTLQKRTLYSLLAHNS